ncbi:hypothetical protein MNBD_DELTA01-1265 [hydrothermal vent metagenome]|uniref:Beta-ketoacyl synthase-like N-terminal domain-containing protein n=1 Tax=hydrothermal vent metagenome TaxID=652676 RepID=A0A3B0QQZ2_9ZZZZ
MKKTGKVYIKGAVLVETESFDDPSLGAISARTVFEEERFLLAGVAKTLKASGLAGSAAEENAGFGIVLGVDTVVDGWKAGFFGEVVKDGPLGASPLIFPYTSPNALAARATIAYNLKGDDITIASGPLSFFKAISYGAMLVGSGILEGVVVGGVAEGAVFTVFLSAESGENCIKEVFEQRKGGDGLLPVSTMKESFGLFKDALKESSSQSRAVSLNVCDLAGNFIAITVAGALSGIDAPGHIGTGNLLEV